MFSNMDIYKKADLFATLFTIGFMIAIMIVIAIGVKVGSFFIDKHERKMLIEEASIEEKSVICKTQITRFETIATVKHNGHLYDALLRDGIGKTLDHSPSCTCKNKE
jgi:hypothetical protein